MGDLQEMWRAHRDAAWCWIAEHVAERLPRNAAASRRDPSQREDWASEVLLRACADDGAALRRARPETEALAWVAGVAKRVVAADGRARARHARSASGTSGAARARSLQWTVARFPRSTWALLTPRQQQVLRHRLDGGLTLESTASLLGISVSVVRKVQRAAVHHLAQRAADCGERSVGAVDRRGARRDDGRRTGDTSRATE